MVGADAYAKSFHKDFVGLDLKNKDRHKMMNDLRAYSSDALFQGGEISHTGYLYLIKRSALNIFMLRSMYYTRPFDPVTIITDIKKELK